MNCLVPKRGSNEFESGEPSAPPYYPPQLPYNPNFIEPRAIISDNLRAAYSWSRDSEFYEKALACDEYCGWGRPRRSLYEGVNVPSLSPVSAQAYVPCIARYRCFYYVCLTINKPIVMSLTRPFLTTHTKYGGLGMFT